MTRNNIVGVSLKWYGGTITHVLCKRHNRLDGHFYIDNDLTAQKFGSLHGHHHCMELWWERKEDTSVGWVGEKRGHISWMGGREKRTHQLDG